MECVSADRPRRIDRSERQETHLLVVLEVVVLGREWSFLGGSYVCGKNRSYEKKCLGNLDQALMSLHPRAARAAVRGIRRIRTCNS